MSYVWIGDPPEGWVHVRVTEKGSGFAANPVGGARLGEGGGEGVEAAFTPFPPALMAMTTPTAAPASRSSSAARSPARARDPRGGGGGGRSARAVELSQIDSGEVAPGGGSGVV